MTNTINGKTTKTQILKYLDEVSKQVKDKSLSDRINYSLKKSDSATKADLLSLVKDIAIFFNPEISKPTEASVKPKLAKKTDTATVTTEEKKPEKAPIKKKAESTKTSKNEVKVETAPDLTKKNLPMAKIFPKTIDHEFLGKLTACPDKYKSVKEIREAIENGKVLIFSAYWTKRHLKEFSYSDVHQVKVPKEGFPYNLDTLQALYVCDSIERVYALSTYTEAMFSFNTTDLEPIECESPDGEKFLMRYSSGMEFEIYEAEESESTN